MASIGINPDGKYENRDAAEHVISYIFNPIKTPSNIYCILGSPVIYSNNQINLCFLYESFDFIKYSYNKIHGRQIYHFWLTLSKKESKELSLEIKKDIMQHVCSYIYCQGFQVVAALHELDETGCPDIQHIHFAFNSVNFINGSKYRDDLLMEMIYFFQNILCPNFSQIKNTYKNKRFLI